MQDPESFISLLKGHLGNTLTPEQREEFLDAIHSGAYRDFLGDEILMRLQNPPAPGQRLSAEAQEHILGHILGTGLAGAPVVPISRRKRWLWAAAAACLLILATGAFLYHNYTSHPTTAGSRSLLAANNSNSILPIHLEDGTIIELQPGSKLSYPEHFTGARREVKLEGSAFFKIASDPQRPFYAQSQGLIAHVLGTSFSIDWLQQQKALKVAVRTGKIEVHRQEKENAGAILTPNTQVIYTEGNPSLTPALVDSPQLVNKDKNLVFKATPASQVFAQLQDSYGIDIGLEKEEIGKKLFTGDVSHLPFYTALKIICLSLNQSYIIRRTQIIITKEKN